ncbi:hypothetical protein ABT095_22765 [Kitasatospora sp. NPDC002227]|uniref:hypothetical protein n=1 Tax=Kitasatospora sp. NPDC002227 TaxID=3154773 RepID=UPI00332EF63B
MTQTARTTGLIPGQRTASPVTATAGAVPAERAGGAVRRAFEVARSAWRLRPVAAGPVQTYGESDGQ